MRRTQKPSPTDCGRRRARRPRFEEIEPRILTGKAHYLIGAKTVAARRRMMVDDDPIMLEVVQTYLEEAGFNSFVTTSNPLEAMGLFVALRPDVLLLSPGDGQDAEALLEAPTESMLMENAAESVEMLHELKDMGVRIAVDDFGTGYSSLSYLSRFPIDELKIDRSFIRGLPTDKGSMAIVGAIVALGRELGLKMVAEGVETAPQLEFLRSRQCDQYQGYLCSRPVPPGPLTTLLRRAAT